MAAYKPSQLVSQWVQQPQRTQGQLWKQTVASTVHDAMAWKMPSTQADAEATIRDVLDDPWYLRL